MSDSSYEQYKAKQAQLAKLLVDASEAITVLNMNQYKENLLSLSKKVNDDTFKIQVVGSFKNGKSTFINSFLGSEILPAYAIPCTAVINEVKYGEKKKAVLYFKNPLPEQLPSSIPEKTLSYMHKFEQQQIPPIEIPYEEIEDYAVIPIGKDPKEMLMENPYDHIELFWPLDLLKNGIEIIDSPGLNEHITRTQVTTEYISKVDAVLFVFSANALAGAEEMKFIEQNLRQQEFEDIFFIVNRFDTISKREKEQVRQFAMLKLRDQTKLREGGIFFVSAQNALDGKIDKDQNLLDSSGIPEFEKTLSEFLVNQKGKIKLSQPARVLKSILDEEVLFKTIPQQKGMLNSSLDDLKARYENTRPRLELLHQKKNLMEQRIESLIEQMMPEVRRYINEYYSNLNTNISDWTQNYEAKTKISILSAKKNAEEMVAELSDFIKDKIEKEQIIWRNNTLQPLVSDKVKNILDSIESNLESFYIELDAIKVNISGVNAENTEKLPLWERIAAVGSGLMIGDIGVAAVGGITGLSKDFAKGIAIQIGAYIGLAIFGLLNPLTIGLVIGVAIINAIIGSRNNIENKIKREFINATLRQINDNAPESIDTMINSVREKVSNISSIVLTAMNSEISEVKTQVQDIISQMEKGQADIDKRKSLLISCEKKAKDISIKLSDFIFQLIK